MAAAPAWAQPQPSSAPAVTESQDQPAPEDSKKGPGPGQEGEQTRPRAFDLKLLLPVLAVFFLMYVLMQRGPRKEQKRRKEMLEALKKGDKITSIGGIIGTVMDIKGDEVTVKVDESANVRMKFARWAIRGVGEAAKAESPQEQEKRSEKK